MNDQLDPHLNETNLKLIQDAFYKALHKMFWKAILYIVLLNIAILVFNLMFGQYSLHIGYFF